MYLYYYTTTNTMQYILKNGNIHATNMRYMNDSEEYNNGIKEIKELINNETLLREKYKRMLTKEWYNKIKEIFSENNLQKNLKENDIYSISFCENNDKLNQWCNYAKESGVSIKLNFNDSGMSFSDRNTNKVIANQMKPQKLYYYTKASMTEDEYKKVSYELLDLILDDEVYVREDFFEDLPERWKRISAFVKRYDFNQESEYRLVFNRKQLESEPKIEYRMDKQVLKPYIDVGVENGWPIEEITIGPGFNQDIVYVSIQHFLNNAEIKNGIVTKGDFCRRIEEYLNHDKKIFQENIWDLNSVKNIKCNLDNETEKHEEISHAERHFLRNLVDLTVTEIIEAGKTKKEYERVKYYQDNYFTNSGIVLNKSSIPYIF